MRGRKKNQRKGDLGEEKGKLDCKEGSGSGVEGIEDVREHDAQEIYRIIFLKILSFLDLPALFFSLLTSSLFFFFIAFLYSFSHKLLLFLYGIFTKTLTATFWCYIQLMTFDGTWLKELELPH